MLEDLTQPGARTVVVAEDEVLSRMMAVEALSKAGFETLEAPHGAGALFILETQASTIHALFTDIHMPGELTGLALAHHTNRHWPWIALLLASGRSSPEPHEMPVGCRFVSKPYELDQVISHLKEMTSSA